MLPDQATHGGPVQEVVQPPIRDREPVDPMAQWPAEPWAEWHGKPQLRVLQDLGRHEPADRPPEDPFSCSVADLPVCGQPERELDECMVEQWYTRLQGDGHARPVHLGQDVTREVRGDVHEHHLGHEVAGSGGLERVGEDVVELAVPWHEAGGGDSAIDRWQRQPDATGIRRLARAGAIEQAAPAGCNMRKGVTDGAEQGASPGRHGRTPQGVEVARIAAEQLVAAVPGQTHRHLLTREPRDEIRGKGRGIRERLVEDAHHAFHPPVCIRSHDQVRVARADRLGDAAGVGCLVERRLIEADREGARPDRCGTRHQRHHRRRIEPARQERSEGHLGLEVTPHGVSEEVADTLLRRGFVD